MQIVASKDSRIQLRLQRKAIHKCTPDAAQRFGPHCTLIVPLWHSSRGGGSTDVLGQCTDPPSSCLAGRQEGGAGSGACCVLRSVCVREECRLWHSLTAVIGSVAQSTGQAFHAPKQNFGKLSPFRGFSYASILRLARCPQVVLQLLASYACDLSVPTRRAQLAHTTRPAAALRHGPCHILPALCTPMAADPVCVSLSASRMLAVVVVSIVSCQTLRVEE